MRYFSVEDHGTGRRRFVAATYEEFWRRYKDIDWDKRHHYEIIRAGLPCHLYFDLEFPVEANSDVNGVACTDALLELALEVRLRTTPDSFDWSTLYN